MKEKIFRTILLITLSILIILTGMPYAGKNDKVLFSLPGLPRPIAKEPVIITSAGQSTNTYIIRDISNQLMIRSFFMPQAKDVDIKDIKTIVFVVGYSSLGMKYQNTSYDDEKKRIKKLLKESKDKDLTVLTIVIGGIQLRDDKIIELLSIICAQTDYLIGIRESKNDSILAELAKNGNIPLTLVNGVNDISEPFASAFR